MKQTKTTVLILGAGPAGLLAAHALATAEIPCMLVERRDSATRNTLPCTQRLSVRTLEVLRQLGLDTAVQTLAQKTTNDQPPNLIFTSAVNHPELARFALSDPPDMAEHSPVSPIYVNQSQLETHLAERVAALPHVTLHEAHEWVQVTAGTATEPATAVIRPLYGGERILVQADYIIAADGADSLTARLLGRTYKSEGDLPQMLTIHFRAAGLSSAQGNHYWLFNQRLVGLVTPVVGVDTEAEWVLHLPFMPPAPKMGTLSAADCTELIRTAVDDYQLTPEVLNTAVWPMRTQLLERFDVGERIFFVGDAAHQFSLLNDAGLNTAVQGVHNLVWKMQAVCRGWADPALLTSYDTEWRPYALQRIQYNHAHLHELMALFNLNLADLYQIQAWLARGSTRVLPHEVQENLPAIALRRQLDILKILVDDSERGERRRKVITNRMQERGGAWFQPWGMVLGQAYAQGAVVTEYSPQPRGVNPLTDYVPSTWPGSRLPHVWLTRLHPTNDQSERLSTLDLVTLDSFLWLTSNAAWAETATAVAEKLGVPLKTVLIGEQGDVQDAQGRWSVVAGIGTAGAVLVRPDGHVAWRSLQLPDTAVAEQVLHDVFTQLTRARFLRYAAIPSSTPPSISIAEQEIKRIYQYTAVGLVVLGLLWLLKIVRRARGEGRRG